MIAPDAGDFVQHRFGGVRVCSDNRQREIRRHEGVGQGRETSSDQDELHAGRRLTRSASRPASPFARRPVE